MKGRGMAGEVTETMGERLKRLQEAAAKERWYAEFMDSEMTLPHEELHGFVVDPAFAEYVLGLERMLRRCCTAVTEMTGDEQTDANRLGEAMSHWQEADSYVNDKFCDMECRAAQAESQLTAAQSERDEARRGSEWG